MDKAILTLPEGSFAISITFPEVNQEYFWALAESKSSAHARGHEAENLFQRYHATVAVKPSTGLPRGAEWILKPNSRGTLRAIPVEVTEATLFRTTVDEMTHVVKLPRKRRHPPAKAAA